MPTSDDVIRRKLEQSLPEDVKGKIPDIMSLLTQYDLTSPSALANVQQNLGMLGVPKDAITGLVDVAKQRGAEQTEKADKEAKDKYDFTPDTPEEIMAALGPEQFAPPDLSGFTDVDWGKIAGEVEKLGQPAPAAPEKPAPTVAEQRDEQFGDDMAWLDPIFQQTAPTREETQAKYGQTADEHAAARQRQAADEMFKLYEQGGRGAQERAARAKARAESEDLLRGQREADMQNLAERGMGGSGAELAAMLGGNQAAGQRLSAADLQASADAEQRALDALMGGQKIESGLQTAANDYTMKGAGLIGDIEAKTKDRLYKGYRDTQNARNEWQGKLLGTKEKIASGTAASDATEQHVGYGQGESVASKDAGAANDLTGKKNTTTVGVDQGAAGRAGTAGQSVVTQTGDEQKQYGEGIDAIEDIVKKGASLGAA